jgi:hypothetical protein
METVFTPMSKPDWCYFSPTNRAVFEFEDAAEAGEAVEAKLSSMPRNGVEVF